MVTVAFPWIGGKFYSADRIIQKFPSPGDYDSYVEVFGGGAHVLLRKPRWGHMETYNDLNGDLVNFWMAVRDHPEQLKEQLELLPYSRQLYDWYRQHPIEEFPSLERAAGWYYCQRATFGGKPVHQGWAYRVRKGHNSALVFQDALDDFQRLAARMTSVQIEHLDYADLIKRYARKRTLLYVDPPYVGTERMYQVGDMPEFGEAQHRELARLLNDTPAMVALSYYDHPLIRELYPGWRVESWPTWACAQNVKDGGRQPAQELLLMNYPPSQPDLWYTSGHDNLTF